MRASSVPTDFDPTRVPVHAVDAHLPAVVPEDLRPESLRRAFARPPVWSPELRAERLWVQRPPAAAAVLVPVVVHERPTVLLTRRSAGLSNHSGQVAFPGGRVDPQDKDAVHAALRETEEEIGLDRQFVEPIGELPAYATGSAFVITPVVALVRSGFSLTLNAGEVDDAFEVPLDFLMDPAHHRRHVTTFDGVRREWYSMPYPDGQQERFIWGATAGMLRNLYRLLSAVAA